MDCPKCEDGTLVKRNLKGASVELDQCSSCEGLWFDAGELAHVLGKKAVRTLEIPSIAIRDDDCCCPRCQKPLSGFCYPGTMTLVEACQDCKGIWLDDNEWKEIKTVRSAANQMVCPKCNTRQAKSDSCESCGIIIAKYGRPASSSTKTPATEESQTETAATPKSYADDIPGLKGSLLRFIDRTINSLTNF